MNEWDEEETPTGLSISATLETKETVIVNESPLEIQPEQSWEMEEEVHFGAITVEERIETEPEIPPSPKEKWFMKIEELLWAGKITEAQAEEYFIKIGSGDIDTVIQELGI